MINNVEIAILVISILIPIAFAFNGHKKGFIKLAVTLLFMAANLVLSIYINSYISNFIIEYTNLPDSKLVAFIISYIIVMLILKITVLSMEMISRIPVLNGINKFLGFVAGLAEGFFVLWFSYLIPMVVIPELFSGLMNSNQVLSFLYNNNLLFNALVIFT